MRNSTPLEELLESFRRPDLPGLVMAIARGEERWRAARGNLDVDSQFFIASATKLYITALTLQLVDTGRIELRDAITKRLPGRLLERLHVWGGVDHSHELTIEHLLSHTSGLPDYFQAVRKGEGSLMDRILAGEDRSWNVDEVCRQARELGAVFAPSSGKALYSDTNYQLLGALIEEVTGERLADVIQSRICDRLNLTKTYLYEDENDGRPAPLNYRNGVLRIPKAMVSFGPDGGVVSTADEGLDFLKGFFEGRLFAPRHLPALTATWRKIFFPLRYGVGVSLFRLPWFFSPFAPVPDLVGHSGLSGAFLFHCPKKNLFLSGTVNQIDKPQTSFRLMIKALSRLG